MYLKEKPCIDYDPWPYINPHSSTPAIFEDDDGREGYEGDDFYILPDGKEVFCDNFDDNWDFIKTMYPDWIRILELPSDVTVFDASGFEMANGTRYVVIDDCTYSSDAVNELDITDIDPNIEVRTVSYDEYKQELENGPYDTLEEEALARGDF